MKREFMSISGLKKVLSPKEMKNITGGSYPTCLILCGDEFHFGLCAFHTAKECKEKGQTSPGCTIEDCYE